MAPALCTWLSGKRHDRKRTPLHLDDTEIFLRCWANLGGALKDGSELIRLAGGGEECQREGTAQVKVQRYELA